MPKLKKHRPFLTYNQQLSRIKEKNIYVDDDEFALEILKTISYYGIVNGYKDIFGVEVIEGTDKEIFPNGTSFNVLHLLYLIDNSLNNLLFKYIIYIEKSLKTKIAYNVANRYGVHEYEYLDYTKYATNKVLDRKTEINNINEQIKNNKNSASIQHYREEHDCIPPWIAVNALYFGTVINWYKILRDDLKIKITSEFFKLTALKDPESQKDMLSSMLSLLQEYRNNIAHGNRTFLTNVNTKLSKTNLFCVLPHNTLSEDEYRNDIGKKDLFAVMLSIAILIDNKLLLQQYIYDIETLFSPYNGFENISPKGNIFDTLGIPSNTPYRLKKIYFMKFNEMI